MKKYMKKYMKKNNKQYGGESGNRPNGILPDVTATDTSGKTAIQQLALEQQSHSDAIKAMEGGKSVGLPCCKNDGQHADYTYPCPAGKCGPISQFPNDSNGIISKVMGNLAGTYTGTHFNSQYDSGSNLW